MHDRRTARWASPIAVVLAAVPAVQAAPGPDIEHEPIACAVAESFVPVSARVSSDRLRARVEFRTGSGAWYSVTLSGNDGTLSGTLPRPGSALDSFRYRIVAQVADSSPVIGDEHVVRVAAAPECPGFVPAHLAPGASVVVAVPPGAPIVPPVPAGFNPAGAIASSEAAGNRPSRLGPIAGGAAVLGGLGGLAAVFGSHASESTGSGPGPTDADLGPVQISLVGSDPPPGSTVSFATDRLTLVVRVDARRLLLNETRTLRADLFPGSGPTACVSLSLTFTQVGTPQDITLGGPLQRQAGPGCEGEFEVTRARVTILGVFNNLILQTGDASVPDLAVDYRFVP